MSNIHKNKLKFLNWIESVTLLTCVFEIHVLPKKSVQMGRIGALNMTKQTHKEMSHLGTVPVTSNVFYQNARNFFLANLLSDSVTRCKNHIRF